MRLAVLGATGRTGRLLVREALAGGHDVSALARDTAKLPDGVQAVEGDAADRAAVVGLLEHADALVSALGPVKGGSPTLMQDAAAAVLAVPGPVRIIWMTGAGVRAPEDRPQLADKAIVTVMKLVARRTLEDSAAAVQLIRASDREWVVVRAPRLIDAAASGAPRVGFIGPDSGTKCARADAAVVLLQQLGETEWLRRMPVVWTP